jgi:hypothetical protein
MEYGNDGRFLLITRKADEGEQPGHRENDITLQPLNYANTPLRRHADTFPYDARGCNTNCAAQFIVLFSR